MSDRPEWITPGREVAVISGRYHTVTAHTIDRVLKRDIVLSNGDRWSLTSVAPNGEHVTKRSKDAWGPTSALFPADRPRVAAAEQAEKRRVLRRQLWRMVSEMEEAARQDERGSVIARHEEIGAFLETHKDAL